MEEFESDDLERPIESYPGFIGMTSDWDFFPQDELRRLENVPWDRYRQLLEWVPDDHTIQVTFRKGSKQISFSEGWNSSIARLLDQVPSIKVFHDSQIEQGPGSCAFYVFFIADKVSSEELEHDVRALETALQSDFRTLEAEHGRDLDEIIRARKSR